MDVAQLKRLIADLPDDALVIVAGQHGTCSEARAEKGFATKPNSMGFCEWMEDPPADRGYDQPAVFLTKERY